MRCERTALVSDGYRVIVASLTIPAPRCDCRVVASSRVRLTSLRFPFGRSLPPSIPSSSSHTPWYNSPIHRAPSQLCFSTKRNQTRQCHHPLPQSPSSRLLICSRFLYHRLPALRDAVASIVFRFNCRSSLRSLHVCADYSACKCGSCPRGYPFDSQAACQGRGRQSLG